MDEAHGAHTHFSRTKARENFAVVKLRNLYAEGGLPFDLCLYQNSQDKLYVRHQTNPFLAALKDDARLHLRMGDDGPGHRPIPGDTLRQIVGSLSTDSDQREAIRAAGFLHPGRRGTSVTATDTQLSE